LSIEDIQPENGWMPIANELAEAFARVKIPKVPMRVLWVILRDTYGRIENREVICCNTTNERLEEITGLCRQSVWEGLSWLEQNGLIRIESSCPGNGTKLSRNRDIFFQKRALLVPKAGQPRPESGTPFYSNGHSNKDLVLPKEIRKEIRIRKERKKERDDSLFKRKNQSARLTPSTFED
jgi:hypothetical protein